MTSVEQPTSNVSTASTVKSRNRLWEWFWRGQALRTAKSTPVPSARARERLRRARLATELGDRAINPTEPLLAGSSVPLALSLYREAAYWALLAHSDDKAAADIREAFAQSRYDFSKSGFDQEQLAEVRSVLVEKNFVQTADEKPETQSSEAELCQRFVHALVDNDTQEDEVAALLLQRWLRIGVFIVVLGAALFGAKVVAKRAYIGPDLALGKNWRASSKAFDCHPLQEECGGAATSVFFHTNEENKPWVEIDLGAPTSIGRIEVVNRDDCCEERAVPLVVQVGNDQIRWRKIATRKEQFQKWELTFMPIKARYIRLHVGRRVAFHLTRVSAWAR
jgi:hypothetical protein